MDCKFEVGDRVRFVDYKYSVDHDLLEYFNKEFTVTKVDAMMRLHLEGADFIAFPQRFELVERPEEIPSVQELKDLVSERNRINAEIEKIKTKLLKALEEMQ